MGKEPVANTENPGKAARKGVLIPLPADDRDAWHQAASDQGYRTTTAFVRQAVREAVEKGVRVRPQDRADLAELLTQLRMAGRNLNVVARQLNVLAKHPLLVTAWRERLALDADRLIEDAEESLAQCGQVQDEIARVLKRLG